MSEIKTGDVVKGTVKTIDKAARAAERLKSVYIRTKEKAEHSLYSAEGSSVEYAADRIADGAGTAARETVRRLDKLGRKSVKNTKENILKVKELFREKRMQSMARHTKPSVKAAGETAAEQVLNTKAKRTAQRSSAMRRAAKKGGKHAMQSAKSAVKSIIAATKALISAIAAGGWIAAIVIIVIWLIGLLVGSCFGIFFSGEDTGTGQTTQTVVREINTDYQTQLDTTKANISYDVLEMSGSRAVWPEVLAVYAVKTTTDPDNAQEVATMDDSKKAILKDIFWEMNDISSHTEVKAEEVITETDDGHGNIVESTSTVTQTYLYITVSHKTAEEMADLYNFSADQRKQLAELLADENRSMWSTVLYGIGTGDGEIVTVALSQLGNVGGEPYWSWYGFNSRVEWCACFVSWCANECGYIDAGIVPKYAGCVWGVEWFRERGLWQDNSYEPRPGDIIFFDWNNRGGSGLQDGLSDHTGIVEKVENGVVYTIEGNSGDSCRERSYPMGHYEILGYGTPKF